MRTALAFLVLVSCAHGAGTAGRGGAGAWLELTSRHFDLRTDVAPDRARKILTDLEHHYIALLALEEFAFLSRRGPTEMANVVVFREKDDFMRVAPQSLRDHRGVHIERDSGEFVVVREPVDTRLLTHELMHGVIHHFLWRAPIWLNEGLATFYSSLKIEDGQLWFGMVSPNARWAQLPPLEKVLHAKYEEFHAPENEASYYAASVMLVYALNSDNATDRRRFVTYVASLGQGMPAEQAWQKAFADLSIADLERRLSQFRRDSGINVWRAPFNPPPIQLGSERAMEDFEVGVLQVQMADWQERSRPWITEYLAHARAAQPNHPDVLYWSAWYESRWGNHAKAKQLFEATVAARPDDARAWHALAQMELAGLRRIQLPDRREGPALEHLKACARAPDDLNFVAWYLSEIGKPTEAIPFIVHALEKAPGCYYCRDTMAQIFFQKGAVARAIEEQRLAVNLIPEWVPRVRQQYVERLAHYEYTARETASPPVPTHGPLPAPTVPTPPATTPPQEPPP